MNRFENCFCCGDKIEYGINLLFNYNNRDLCAECYYIIKSNCHQLKRVSLVGNFIDISKKSIIEHNLLHDNAEHLHLKILRRILSKGAYDFKVNDFLHVVNSILEEFGYFVPSAELSILLKHYELHGWIYCKVHSWVCLMADNIAPF